MPDPHDPEFLSPEARAREVALLLATGYLRLRTLGRLRSPGQNGGSPGCPCVGVGLGPGSWADDRGFRGPNLQTKVSTRPGHRVLRSSPHRRPSIESAVSYGTRPH